MSVEVNRQQFRSETPEISTGGGNMKYLVAGGLLGAAAALLFAPKAGAEFRSDIADVTKKGYDGALDLTNKVKEQTSSLYGTLREKGSSLVEAAANQLPAGAKDTIEKATENTDEIANNVLSLGDQDSTSGSSSSPRRSSTNIV
jgi:gas vesicle protein